MTQPSVPPAPDDEVKRLAPTQDTLRQLYALSGNQCAFDPCSQPIISATGKFIAQVCHIKGVKDERFDKSMSNEERRHVSNLVLLCYPHHIETNDEDEWTVPKMQAMKETHEGPFKAGFQGMINSVRDWTQSSTITPPQSARSYNTSCGWQTFDEDIAGNIEEIMKLAAKVRNLSLNAREFLYTLVRRARFSYHEFGLEAAILEEVMGLEHRHARNLFAQLYAQDLAWSPDEDESSGYFTGPYLVLKKQDYPSWEQLRDFLNDAKLRELIVDLRFDHLD